MPDVSLSTMWGVNRLKMSEFVAKAREYGFGLVELNYQLEPDMLEEITGLPDLAVSSVHIPCPSFKLPNGKWNHDLPLSSLVEEERKSALCYAKAAVDLAARVGADRMVLHLGTILMDRDAEKRLRKLYCGGEALSEAYQELKHYLTAQRAAKVGPFLEASENSLRELSSYAAAKGVYIGLETRYYYHEIPSLDEMEWLVDTFRGDGLGMWYDVGHVEALSRLGFTEHNAWLERLGPRIIGAHLHDLTGLSDHKAPGLGDLDWEPVARHLPDVALRVCELGNFNSDDEVRRAVPFLRDKGII